MLIVPDCEDDTKFLNTHKFNGKEAFEKLTIHAIETNNRLLLSPRNLPHCNGAELQLERFGDSEAASLGREAYPWPRHHRVVELVLVTYSLH